MPHLTQPTFCFGVGEAVSCESEEAGLEILNTKLLPSLGSLDHDAEKVNGNLHANKMNYNEDFGLFNLASILNYLCMKNMTMN